SSDLNVYSTGLFTGTVNFNPNNGKAQYLSGGGVFVSKLSASGSYVDAAGLAASTTSNNGRALALDGAGNVYLTGVFSGTADFDPTAGTYNLTSNGSVDAFVAKLTQSGTSPFAGGPLANDKTDQLLDASPSDVMRYATIPTGAEFHVADSNLHGVRVADEFVNLSLRDEGEFAKSGEPVAR